MLTSVLIRIILLAYPVSAFMSLVRLPAMISRPTRKPDGYLGRYYVSSTYMQTAEAASFSSSLKLDDVKRKELWKSISDLERRSVELLSSGDEKDQEEAFKLLAESVCKRKHDPFFQIANDYDAAVDNNDPAAIARLMAEMKSVGLPPHLAALVSAKKNMNIAPTEQFEAEFVVEEVDPSSNFSDTMTDKIRVKVHSYYDADKSEPANGKYMFWYKVGIYNEGPEPVQVVARMWEIEKCRGEKETVRGAGIMSTQPIIAPGDVFTYQSVCPLKVFPPKGKRVLASMSGAYTMCKGNMGQYNFTVKVGKFNMILPETVATAQLP